MQRRFSRRTFLVRSGTVITGIATGLWRHDVFAAPAALPIYGLDTCGGGCEACRACHKHADNKIFASEDAAKASENRAHPYCNCDVLPTGTLPYKTWVTLFGPPRQLKRSHVDRRWPWVNAILTRQA